MLTRHVFTKDISWCSLASIKRIMSLAQERAKLSITSVAKHIVIKIRYRGTICVDMDSKLTFLYTYILFIVLVGAGPFGMLLIYKFAEAVSWIIAIKIKAQRCWFNFDLRVITFSAIPTPLVWNHQHHYVRIFSKYEAVVKQVHIYNSEQQFLRTKL